MVKFYHSFLLFRAIILLFRLKIPSKIILVDFDFTLVSYDLSQNNKLEIINATLNCGILRLCEKYVAEGYTPVLFTARGLRSKKALDWFLSKNSTVFNARFFLGSTANKFVLLKFILSKTNSSVVLIDDLSDYNESTMSFTTHNLYNQISPNSRLLYINPVFYEGI